MSIVSLTTPLPKYRDRYKTKKKLQWLGKYLIKSSLEYYSAQVCLWNSPSSKISKSILILVRILRCAASCLYLVCRQWQQCWGLASLQDQHWDSKLHRRLSKIAFKLWLKATKGPLWTFQMLQTGFSGWRSSRIFFAPLAMSHGCWVQRNNFANMKSTGNWREYIDQYDPPSIGV